MSVAVVEAVISWRKQKESGLKPQEEQQQEEEEENIYIVHQEEVNTHTQAVIHTQLRSYTHTSDFLFVYRRMMKTQKKGFRQKAESPLLHTFLFLHRKR